MQVPSNGATNDGVSGGNQDVSYAGTMGVTKGKWYFENYINEKSTYGARHLCWLSTHFKRIMMVLIWCSTKGRCYCCNGY